MKQNFLLLKKTIFISLLLASIVLLSCSKKDDLTNNDISGTTWISSNWGTVNAPLFEKINFMSNGAFYMYESTPNSTEHNIVWGMMVYGGLYEVKGNTITFTTSLEVNTGSISGNTINVVMLGESMTFTKQ